MLTNIHAKQLAAYYNMSEQSLHSYLAPHRKELEAMKVKRQIKKKKKIIERSIQNFTTEALSYIVFNIMKDTPEGYEWNGKTLIEIVEK